MAQPPDYIMYYDKATNRFTIDDVAVINPYIYITPNDMTIFRASGYAAMMVLNRDKNGIIDLRTIDSHRTKSRRVTHQELELMKMLINRRKRNEKIFSTSLNNAYGPITHGLL